MEGKFYAITGAGSGIGRATAIRCAELGASGVTLCDLSTEGLEVSKKMIEEKSKTKVLIRTVDIAKSDQVDSWIEDAVKEFSKLDGAANVAGLSMRHPDTTSANIIQKDWDRTVAVNLTGTMNCQRAQLRVLTRPGGSIVNVSSGAGMRGVAGMPSYSATKWGMRGLSKTAAAEFGPVGIRINTLIPGPIASGENFQKVVESGRVDPNVLSSGTMLKRMGTPEEVAKMMVFLMSDDASYITGADIAVDGGGNSL
ncbi:putative short chain dehydrogenase/ reductase [Cadophora sp. DSE1049]|nr:putative short chain dehydrogenase/ reductase [Cadophora sp. DSE1049]